MNEDNYYPRDLADKLNPEQREYFRYGIILGRRYPGLNFHPDSKIYSLTGDKKIFYCWCNTR